MPLPNEINHPKRKCEYGQWEDKLNFITELGIIVGW
jgi:hypothetical protein